MLARLRTERSSRIAETAILRFSQDDAIVVVHEHHA
jgi:hypothetical protein